MARLRNVPLVEPEVLDEHLAVGGEDAGVQAGDVGVVGQGDGAAAGPADGELVPMG